MISGILIFNQKGENLIFRAFRNDCRPRLADVFRIQVISNAQVRSPILTLGSTTFSHVKHENIYLVVVTRSNANAALVFEFLYRFIALGKGYFGKLDEEAIKNNFVLVYELLDGIPSYNSSSSFSQRLIVHCRDYRFRLPSEYRDGHPQALHYYGRSQIGAYNRRLFEDYYAGHRSALVAKVRYQISKE